jgi:hypothetical protein
MYVYIYAVLLAVPMHMSCGVYLGVSAVAHHDTTASVA